MYYGIFKGLDHYYYLPLCEQKKTESCTKKNLYARIINERHLDFVTIPYPPHSFIRFFIFCIGKGKGFEVYCGFFFFSLKRVQHHKGGQNPCIISHSFFFFFFPHCKKTLLNNSILYIHLDCNSADRPLNSFHWTIALFTFLPSIHSFSQLY